MPPPNGTKGVVVEALFDEGDTLLLSRLLLPPQPHAPSVPKITKFAIRYFIDVPEVLIRFIIKKTIIAIIEH